MSKLDSIQKVLIIGSGPIVIGQAAEFDYTGTQACRVLREEGAKVTLINSNPATIIAGGEITDRVYIEPLTIDTLKRVILKKRPGNVLPTLGGQNALSLTVELEESDFLMEHNAYVISTNADTIRITEDHELFREAMARIQQPCAGSEIAEAVEGSLLIAKCIGYPVVVRPAYTLGDGDDGIAYTEKQLHTIASMGLHHSRANRVLIECCVSGWEEIEHKVIRDDNDNCITVCSMENFDPVGVYTGDSIVITPYQTLADKEIQVLHSASIAIIDELKVEGGCNVRFALNPESFEYYVAEVDLRVSRSSTLASKATGYPIAKVASKIALGCTLGEIQNAITEKTYTCFEPTLDYCVMKIPKWLSDKFVHARHSLGTQMKVTSEIIGIAPTPEAALMRSIRCLEQNIYDLTDAELDGLSDLDISERIHAMDDRRLFAVAEALRRGFAVEEIHNVTKTDRWFLQKPQSIIVVERRLANEPMSKELLLKTKSFGFLNETVAGFSSISIEGIRGLKEKWVIRPAYKMAGTYAAKFEAETPYCYSSYGDENESRHESDRKKITIVGSGPIRVGQGTEFDFCSVHSVWALKKLGFETIIMNSNPETVGTDFDITGKLYFESLTPEDIWHIIELEKSDRAAVRFGGQTTIKLAGAIEKMGIPLLGTSFDSIDEAEDREHFDAILAKCGIPHATDRMVFICDEALRAAHEPDYPVLVRPSYVLSGQGMDITYNDSDIREQIGIINTIAQEHPILVDKYLVDTEVEIDTVYDGVGTLIPGIMQHVERVGVHSDDSISVYPAQSLSRQVEDTAVDYTRKLALTLRVKGLLNIQFIVKDEQVYIIEANPRSSRTAPYISKTTDVPIVHLAVHTFFGETLPQMDYQYGLQPNKALIAIRMPVFPLERLYGANVNFRPEMESIGEVLDIARGSEEAMIKAFRSADVHLLTNGNATIIVKDQDKEEILPIAKGLCDPGWTIYSTEGTSNYLKENGIPNIRLNKAGGDAPDTLDAIPSGTIDLVISTPSEGAEHRRDGFLVRRNTVETGTPCLTSLDTASAFLRCVQHVEDTNPSVVDIMKVSSFLTFL